MKEQDLASLPGWARRLSPLPASVPEMDSIPLATSTIPPEPPLTYQLRVDCCSLGQTVPAKNTLPSSLQC